MVNVTFVTVYWYSDARTAVLTEVFKSYKLPFKVFFRKLFLNIFVFVITHDRKDEAEMR